MVQLIQANKILQTNRECIALLCPRIGNAIRLKLAKKLVQRFVRLKSMILN